MTSLARSNRFDVVLTAFNYNVLFREAASSVIPAAVENDMGIVLGSAFGQGFLTRRADEEVQQRPLWLAESRQQQLLAYYKLLDEVGMPAFELCLRFVLSNPSVSTIPIGCKTVEHLEASVAAAEKGPLPDDVIRRLDRDRRDGPEPALGRADDSAVRKELRRARHRQHGRRRPGWKTEARKLNSGIRTHKNIRIFEANADINQRCQLRPDQSST